MPDWASVASLPGAVAFGSTPSSTPETVSFILDEQDIGQLEASAETGTTNYLSVAQFAQAYGQSQGNIAQLQAYLSRSGIATTVYPNDIDVVATGTAGEFDSALSHAPGAVLRPRSPRPARAVESTGPDGPRQHRPARAAGAHSPVRSRHPRAVQL